MRGRMLPGCSVVVLAMLAGASPAAACPWNGCGTDAANAAQAYVAQAGAYAPAGYLGPPPGYYAQGYTPMVYGYTYVQPYSSGAYYSRLRRYSAPAYRR